MNYREFCANIKKEALPLYVIVGDGLLVTRVLQQIASTINTSIKNASVFDSENYNISSVISACEQLSFDNAKRIVILKNINTIPESDKKQLDKYAGNPNLNTVLVLIDNLNTKVFDFINCSNIDLKNISQNEIITIANELAEANNKTLNNIAMQKLVMFVAGDLTRLKTEIDKLCSYVGERTEITSEDIELLINPDQDIIVYDLTDALAQKNCDKAITILSQLLSSPEQNSRLFSLILSCFRRIFFASTFDGTIQELSTLLNVKEYAVKKAKQQAKLFSPKKLKEICEMLVETEYAYKSGKMTLENSLYYAVAKILN